MRDMVVLINLDGVACRSMARKLRAEHIYCKIMPQNATAEDVTGQDALGILLAGGSTGEPVEIPHLAQLLEAGLPMLAMGDAALTLCQALGGEIHVPQEETAHVLPVYFTKDPLVEGVENGERYFHALRTMSLPEGLRTMADSSIGALGFRMEERSVYGLGFQVEQNDTDGMQLLINFCQRICGCTLWWSDLAFIDRAQEEIARVAEGGSAICALSGGVDSGVCALLGHKALGHRLHCIFIDNGLLRKNEGDRVEAFFRDQAGLNFKRINAGETFIEALRGVKSQREKENIIFSLLTQLFQQEVDRLPDVHIMLQGTNYSDTMEQSGKTDTLHGLRLVEPVCELFKDEIRRVGEELELPASIINRQPFPGSGLALRVLGEVTPERLDMLREADAIFRSALEDSGQSKRLWQYFATLAPNPADEEDAPGSYIVTLRAVQAVDGAAAMPARLPNDLLERISEEILANVPGVRRVLYDLTPSHNYAHVDWR